MVTRHVTAVKAFGVAVRCQRSPSRFALVPPTVVGTRVPVIGRAALIRNKTASARPKDLADVAILGASSVRAKQRRK